MDKVPLERIATGVAKQGHGPRRAATLGDVGRDPADPAPLWRAGVAPPSGVRPRHLNSPALGVGGDLRRQGHREPWVVRTLPVQACDPQQPSPEPGRHGRGHRVHGRSPPGARTGRAVPHPAMIRIAISVEAFEAIARTLPLGSVGYETVVNERERIPRAQGRSRKPPSSGPLHPAAPASDHVSIHDDASA